MSDVVTVTDTDVAVFQDTDRQVVVAERPDQVIVTSAERGPRGVPGPQGPAGTPGGSTVDYEAGTTIHSLRAVAVINGEIIHPDISTPGHASQVIGIATQSGLVGDTVAVQVAGTYSEASWTWAPGFVYCGDDGVLTQSPGASGWLLAIGRATSPTTISVDIDTPYMRA